MTILKLSYGDVDDEFYKLYESIRNTHPSIAERLNFKNNNASDRLTYIEIRNIVMNLL